MGGVKYIYKKNWNKNSSILEGYGFAEEELSMLVNGPSSEQATNFVLNFSYFLFALKNSKVLWFMSTNFNEESRMLVSINQSLVFKRWPQWGLISNKQ